ncbi:hypothetical protein E2C01_020142 [Portunus trituberculatus]|uniref:Uncharacterized protein n=2 Tax=Portunus trituberculatus TaxID=210409 RepID=A0A5B7DZD9_PORTR|nr:hypothetical protein [Portunus trituberculatus]
MEKLKEKQDESSPSNKPKKKAAQVPAGRRRILEQERQRVVEAYRSLKASKYTLTQQSTM